MRSLIFKSFLQNLSMIKKQKGPGKFGEHRLAKETVAVPPERKEIKKIQAEKPLLSYHAFDAVDEARQLGMLRKKIRHAELSPTFRCPEDCGGCPDRISLHVGELAEKQIGKKEWFAIINKLIKLGVEYFLLIGGTIDSHPLTPEMMQYILDKEPPTDVGWFTDGIMLQDWQTGKFNFLFERLNGNDRLLQLTTHVSADYLVNEGVNSEGPILNPSKRWENEYGGSRYYKSAFSERLVRNLIKKGAKRVVLNTAISAHNIDEVIKVYDFVGELQNYALQIDSPTVVLHTFSPWTWRPHLARGDNPRNYDQKALLSQKHIPKLQEISRYILADTQARIKKGKPRINGNSSGYIAGLPDFAVTQDVPYLHGSGELAVLPDGTVRIDPVFISVRELQVAKSPYGYRDRDIDFPPFARYDKKIKSSPFPNLIQSTRGKTDWR